jgi:hypothetical protein
LIVVADKAQAGDVIAAFNAGGERAFVIGALIAGSESEPEVRYRGNLVS